LNSAILTRGVSLNRDEKNSDPRAIVTISVLSGQRVSDLWVSVHAFLGMARQVMVELRNAASCILDLEVLSKGGSECRVIYDS